MEDEEVAAPEREMSPRPITVYLVIAAILYEEIYRKRFLPTATDEDLERLARVALLEKRSMGN